MTAYQVVAECAHVTVTEAGGIPAMKLLYKGAPVPDGVDPKRLKHLLDNHLIAAVDGVPLAPNASVDQDPARGLDSVTTEVLQGEKPEEPRQDPALEAGERVQATVTAEGAIDKAAESPNDGPDVEVERRRTAAQAKLAKLGGKTPDGRSSEDVLVEYLAGKGYGFDELSKQSKPELLDLVEKTRQS